MISTIVRAARPRAGRQTDHSLPLSHLSVCVYVKDLNEVNSRLLPAIEAMLYMITEGQGRQARPRDAASRVCMRGRTLLDEVNARRMR